MPTAGRGRCAACFEAGRVCGCRCFPVRIPRNVTACGVRPLLAAWSGRGCDACPPPKPARQRPDPGSQPGCPARSASSVTRPCKPSPRSIALQREPLTSRPVFPSTWLARSAPGPASGLHPSRAPAGSACRVSPGPRIGGQASVSLAWEGSSLRQSRSDQAASRGLTPREATARPSRAAPMQAAGQPRPAVGNTTSHARGQDLGNRRLGPSASSEAGRMATPPRGRSVLRTKEATVPAAAAGRPSRPSARGGGATSRGG